MAIENHETRNYNELTHEAYFNVFLCAGVNDLRGSRRGHAWRP
jgi:hypothetical protein